MSSVYCMKVQGSHQTQLFYQIWNYNLCLSWFDIQSNYDKWLLGYCFEVTQEDKHFLMQKGSNNQNEYLNILLMKEENKLLVNLINLYPYLQLMIEIEL